MPTQSVRAFDAWIRGRFRDLNTELEEAYFEREDPLAVEGVRDDLKTVLHDEGRDRIVAILAEPLPLDSADEAYDLLGSVGLYMAALRRHELTNPERETRSPLQEASSLAQRLGAAVGVSPRFATAHINLINLAVDGHHKSFTHLADELLFTTKNSQSILDCIRAADILRRILPLGVTSPLAAHLFEKATDALVDVLRNNQQLDEQLDIDRFFLNVRPYFKTYRVGRMECRGANAGDFAAINEIDLMLGLCRITDPSYSAIILEKMPFLATADQQQLQATSRKTSLMDEFLAVADRGLPQAALAPLRAFIGTCEAHGQMAAQHTDRLVRRFVEQPSTTMQQQHLQQITASGPPLQAVMAALEALRDKRLGAKRPGIDSRHDDLERLRSLCGLGAASQRLAIGS